MSVDQDDAAAWIDQAATERAERHAARQRQRRADRAEFGQRRRAGLARRQAGKLSRLADDGTMQDRPMPAEDRCQTPVPPCCQDSGAGECPQHATERRRRERAAKLARRRPGATWTRPVRA